MLVTKVGYDGRGQGHGRFQIGGNQGTLRGRRYEQGMKMITDGSSSDGAAPARVESR